MNKVCFARKKMGALFSSAPTESEFLFTDICACYRQKANYNYFDGSDKSLPFPAWVLDSRLVALTPPGPESLGKMGEDSMMSTHL
jgi:hypothetical protein